MKKFPIVLVVAAFVLFLTACQKETIQPSATITTVEKNITDFNAVEVAGDFEVFITSGAATESVTVEANENLQEFITVEKEDNTLEIKMKGNININGNETTKVYISTKEIIDYKVAGDAVIQLENEMVTNKVNIDLGGDAQMNGGLSVQEMVVTIGGDAQLNLSGEVDAFDLKIAGDGRVKDYDLICNKLDAELAGDSEVFITVIETINVTAAGESILHFKGTGEIRNQFTSGDAKIIKED